MQFLDIREVAISTAGHAIPTVSTRTDSGQDVSPKAA